MTHACESGREFLGDGEGAAPSAQLDPTADFEACHHGSDALRGPALLAAHDSMWQSYADVLLRQPSSGSLDTPSSAVAVTQWMLGDAAAHAERHNGSSASGTSTAAGADQPDQSSAGMEAAPIKRPTTRERHRCAQQRYRERQQQHRQLEAARVNNLTTQLAGLQTRQVTFLLPVFLA